MKVMVLWGSAARTTTTSTITGDGDGGKSLSTGM